MDLIKDIIKIDNRIDFGKYQAFLESELVVPDIKEDVFEIIKTQGYISLKKEDIMPGKIILRGDLNYNVIYLTQDKKISNLMGRLDLNEVIEKENISANMKALLRGEIEHISCSILNERKIKLGSLVNIKGSLFGREKMDIVREISGLDDVQSYKEHVEYEDIVGIESAESVIRENVQLEQILQGIESIVSITPKLRLKETRISDNKVILGGSLDIEPIALSKEGELIKLSNYRLDYTQFIEIPGALEGMRENVFLDLIDFNFNLKEDEEGKSNSLEIDAIVKSKVKVSETVSREVLQDAYCPYRGLKLDEKHINLNKLISFGTEDIIIKEKIQNDREDIEIKEILSIDPKIFITDNNIMEGKNILEGIAQIDISYIPVEALRPIYTITEEIPFRHSIDLMSEKENVNPYGNIEIESMDYSISNNEVNVNIKAKAIFEVVEESKNRFIVNGELQGNIDVASRPSITVYIAKEGETLWNVAKRYNTTLEEIAQTNELEESDVLREGQCLIIEKKVTFEI